MQGASVIARIWWGVEVLWLAWNRFALHDTWALASHIALSLLMAMFPFLIFLASLATFLGAGSLSDAAVQIILQAWPEEIAGPIAREVKRVLTVRRGDILTFGVLLSLFFASSGVESLRTGLNRAYGTNETRSWWLLRLESLVAVAIGALMMLSFAILIVFAPLWWRWLIAWIPALKPMGGWIAFLRIGVASVVIVIALFAAHIIIPSRWRSIGSVVPGIVVTLVLWICGGLLFAWYLDSYSANYVSTYGGLATAMMALVFLYLFAAIFLYGGEINGVIIAAQNRKRRSVEQFRSRPGPDIE